MALMSVVIETPYVGQGVDVGTGVIMHGVEIGQVTGVSSLPGGGVRLSADLQAASAAGLTDTLGIDFRPANYFGVTGVNLVRGGGGRPLEDGMRIQVTPRGNFALQTLLSRLGEITDGVVTPQLVQVIDRSTAYVDGLNPLIETMLMVTKAVDNVQTVSTARLLANATGLSAVFPFFVDAATESGHVFDNAGLIVFDHTGGEVTEEFWQKHYLPTVELATYGLFGAVGKLESSHVEELLPAVEIVKTLTDTVPGLVRPEDFAETMTELRRRFENMYGGSPEQRALQVRIVLDNLPGVAAPLGAMGVTP
ncbi:Mammalian cell entry related domain protein [Mycolicibacterium elephantis]